MLGMTPRERQRRLILIANRAELATDPTTDSGHLEIEREVKERVASHVGLWVAYHRGLAGWDKYAIRRR